MTLRKQSDAVQQLCSSTGHLQESIFICAMCNSLSQVITVTVQYWIPFINTFSRVDYTVSKDRMSE